jgi:hypothetical protein
MFYIAIRAHGSFDVGLPPVPFFPAAAMPHLLAIRGAARLSSPDTIIEAITTGTVRAAAVLQWQQRDSLAEIKKHLRETIRAFGRMVFTRSPHQRWW